MTGLRSVDDDVHACEHGDGLDEQTLDVEQVDHVARMAMAVPSAERISSAAASEAIQALEKQSGCAGKADASTRASSCARVPHVRVDQHGSLC